MADFFDFKPVCVEWDERHAQILQSFLMQLDNNNIKYVILKNDDGLPFVNRAKDVDIVIEPGTYKTVAILLQQAYKEGGVTYYKIHKFERLRCWYGFDLNSRFAIHIDILEGFLHKGFEMFPFHVLYSHAHKNKNGIYVLDDVFSSVVLLLHSTICYHKIKSKYVDKISVEYKKNKVIFDSHIIGLFPNKGARTLIELLEHDDYAAIEKKGKWFSHQSKIRIIIRRPIFTLINVFDFLWEKIERMILNCNRYNTFFSVHAPDGTGKTTFIQSLSELLGFYFVCEANALVDIHHFRPLLFPNLGAVGEKVRVMKQDTNFTEPHRAKPASMISSFVRMMYYWLDYVVGMPIILRKNAQFNKITIFDRYIYDFLVDPYRTRIKLPYWLRKTFAKLVKQPKIVFVLDADVNTIYSRKQELSKEEIERQLVEFRKLKQIGKQVHVLDATQTPQQIANDAMKIIVNTFSKKIIC